MIKLSKQTNMSSSISSLHQDIIQTHILTRLDGPTLAAVASSSSQLNTLSTQDHLWKHISTSNWPSINSNPRVSHVISTFPSGHRSFFSDAFPVLDHRRKKTSPNSNGVVTTELISCVDIYYKDVLILSKTRETETVTGWFLCSPFRVDLLDPKESVLTPIVDDNEYDGDDDTWLDDVEKNLRVSWVVIDPDRKRAVDLSSRRPVSVQRHWLTGDVQARFSLIMNGGADQRSEMELVKWEVLVTCSSGDNEKGGGVQVMREVSLIVEDMNGGGVSGRDGLVILQDGMENGERKKERESGDEGKVRLKEFVERKREVRLKRIKREQVLDMACIVVGVTTFVTFWGFILFR